jgi:integrase
MKIKDNHFINQRQTKNIVRNNGRNYTIRSNRDRFFYPDEWMVFYDNLKDKQKITFRLLINTGARINEIRNIKVSDVDFDRGNIVLRVTKRIINKVGIQKEGTRKIRIISVSSELIKYLRGIVKDYNLKPDDYFPILSTPAANICMKKTLKEIGIKDYDMFSVHNCRKTLETWLIALEVDSFKVVKHFGHSLQVAIKHYVSPDIFNFEDKKNMRIIIGDLFNK